MFESLNKKMPNLFPEKKSDLKKTEENPHLNKEHELNTNLHKAKESGDKNKILQAEKELDNFYSIKNKNTDKVLNQGVDFIPVVGSGKMLAEGITGNEININTKEELGFSGRIKKNLSNLNPLKNPFTKIKDSVSVALNKNIKIEKGKKLNTKERIVRTGAGAGFLAEDLTGVGAVASTAEKVAFKKTEKNLLEKSTSEKILNNGEKKIETLENTNLLDKIKKQYTQGTEIKNKKDNEKDN